MSKLHDTIKGAKRQKVEKEEIEILRFYFDITVQGSEF